LFLRDQVSFRLKDLRQTKHANGIMYIGSSKYL
jgi:hypothetical protein